MANRRISPVPELTHARLPDDPDPTVPLEADDVDPDPAEVLSRMRPAAPRSWRDRFDDMLVDLRDGPRPRGPATLAAGGLAVLVVALVAVVAWQAMAPPAAAPESGLPVAAPPAADTSMVTATGASVPGPVPVSDATDPTTPDSPVGAATGEVVVHVVGAVAEPGVQRLPASARVVDAIEAAGGATPEADLARVNLAATVADGAQIVVPRPGEELAPAAPSVTPAGPGTAGGGTPSGGGPGDVVNVNTANAAELEALPGVGPAIAAAIVAHRDEAGPFASVDQLVDVRGIGDAKLEQLRPRATV